MIFKRAGTYVVNSTTTTATQSKSCSPNASRRTSRQANKNDEYNCLMCQNIMVEPCQYSPNCSHRFCI